MRDELQTVGKTLDVLMALGRSGGEMRAQELEAELGLSRSTLYRILSTLKRNNFVEMSVQGKYRLGITLLGLGLMAKEYYAVDSVVQPILEKIAMETGETAMLTAVSFPYAICIARAESPKSIRLSFEVGRLMPLCSGASGKILLTYFSQDELHGYLSIARKRGYFHRWQLSEDALLDQLRDATRNGYIMTVGEVDNDAFGIGVPVMDAFGECKFGLSIAGPIQRLDEKRYLEALKRGAEELGSALWGGR